MQDIIKSMMTIIGIELEASIAKEKVKRAMPLTMTKGTKIGQREIMTKSTNIGQREKRIRLETLLLFEGKIINYLVNEISW